MSFLYVLASYEVLPHRSWRLYVVLEAVHHKSTIDIWILFSHWTGVMIVVGCTRLHIHLMEELFPINGDFLFSKFHWSYNLSHDIFHSLLQLELFKLVVEYSSGSIQEILTVVSLVSITVWTNLEQMRMEHVTCFRHIFNHFVIWSHALVWPLIAGIKILYYSPN